MMNDYILGGLEDQVGIFYKNWQVGNSGEVYNPFLSNQPLFSLFYELPASYLNPISYTNFYNIVQVILTAVVGYYFFKTFNFEKKICLSLTLIFTFSPFTFYNFGIHPALLTIWPLLLFLTLIRSVSYNYQQPRLESRGLLTCRSPICPRAKARGFIDRHDKNNIFLGFVLSCAFLFNNYFGYFGLIFFSILSFFEFIISRISLRRYFTVAGSFILFTFVFLLQYLFGSGQSSTMVLAKRPLEDFFYFSSRPWYYFLPSPDNPWVGDYTKRVIDYLQNNWGYWLTGNYFPSEHAVSYLGYINLILALTGIYSIYKNQQAVRKKTLLTLLLTALILVMFTLPPYFTVSMYKIYTPNYLLVSVFPMFRSTVRLSLLILLIQLVFTGFGYEYLKKCFKPQLNYYRQFGFTTVVCILLILSLIEFYVPLKIAKITDTPEIYKFLKTDISEDAVLAVYPYNSAIDVLFWTKEHEKILVNPRDYQSENFNAENFTQELKTSEGLEKAKLLGATHLVFFRYAGEKDRLPEKKFFDKSEKLKVIAEFDSLEKNRLKDSSWLNNFVKIDDLNDFRKTSGTIYEIIR